MKKDDLKQCCHASREDIPWLLNGTLPDAAAAVLREHLEVCSDCKADYESHECMRAAVLGNEVTPLMPATKAEDVIGIDRTGGSQRSDRERLRFGLKAIAASIAVLGVGVILSVYLGTDGVNSNQSFETATSTGTAGGIDYVLRLQFEDEISKPEKDKIVAQLQDVVKWTVGEDGDYEVHVQLSAPSMMALEVYEQNTAGLVGVHSAKFTALQLPVR